VLDNAEGQNYAGVVPETMVFSPDGNHIAYEARREKPGAKAGDKPTLIPFIVVDKMESPAIGAGENEGSLRGSRLIWDDNKKLRSLIIREQGKISLLELELPG
jgi:hypothetical protein